jgi:hypothetical protein
MEPEYLSGIALSYGLDDRRFDSQQWAGKFSLHHRVQTSSGAHPASYPILMAHSLGVNRLGREADNSPPSIAEVNNE